MWASSMHAIISFVGEIVCSIYRLFAAYIALISEHKNAFIPGLLKLSCNSKFYWLNISMLYFAHKMASLNGKTPVCFALTYIQYLYGGYL